MRFLYVVNSDSDDTNDENLESEEDEAEEAEEVAATESDAASNDSDQFEWDDIYDRLRWRDGKILLMKRSGGPSGGWATDATGNLWKWRQQWGGLRWRSLSGLATQDVAHPPRQP